MMRKLYLFVFALLAGITHSHGQGRALLGQYFQNLPAFSPAFTGANDYLDIRTGFRKQWAGFDNAPNTIFLSAYSPIRQKRNPYQRNSLRGSSNGQYYKDGIQKSGVKLGVGGYVLMDEKGPFTELEIMPSLAVHVPMTKHTFLSMGFSGGLLNNSIDLDEITVVDEINDATYLSYVNNGASNSYFNLNFSLGIYSTRYYFSYGIMQVSRTLLSGNEQVNSDGAGTRHHLLGGYRFFAGKKWELIPNTFLRIQDNQPFFFEAGLRARYNENLWIGASYRNDRTIVWMLGLSFNDKINFGYAYEYKNSDFDHFNGGSHEITLGLRLFNYGSYTPIW